MIRRIAVCVIKLYQMFISPLFGPKCRFSPTCSTYAIECIVRFGVVRGTFLSLKRIAKCHPWGPSGYDPPPKLSKNRLPQ